jgi:hypothetical protein
MPIVSITDNTIQKINKIKVSMLQKDLTLSKLSNNTIIEAALDLFISQNG